jgi:hypothetical protein
MGCVNTFSKRAQGQNLQNFLRKTCKIFVSCKVFSCNRATVFDFQSSNYQTLIILTLKVHSTPNKPDILMLKVTKLLRILLKKIVNLVPEV